MKIASRLGVAFVVGFLLCVASTGLAADVVCRLSEKAVQQFADLVFPMPVSGTKKMSALPLGGGFGGLGGEVRWTADVSKPVIRITAAERTFTATVKANAGGITWSGEVKGVLDIDYDAKDKVLVVRVRNAIVPLSIGPVGVPIDVSQEVPTFRFSVALPEITIPEKRSVVRVAADPDIRFEDGAVVVSSDVKFELKAGAR
jgi:hypothetical protein